MLPDESTYLPKLARNLRPQFQYSASSLAEGVAITNGQMAFRKQFPPVVQHSAVGLHVLICRRFRQAIALCQLGQVDSAEAVCRSMFEGLLAQAFICRNSVSLRHRANGGKAETHGKKLTQEFRADLYFAHHFVLEKKRLEKLAKTKGHKRHAKRELKELKPEYDQWCNHIGHGWARSLKNNSCAGLTIEDFAYSLGLAFDRWYRSLYAIQSSFVHGGNFGISLRYPGNRKRPQLKWSDSPGEVVRALRTANYLHGLQQTEFNRLLDKNHGPYIKAGLFRDAGDDFRQVFQF